jgi:hypothetical protein
VDDERFDSSRLLHAGDAQRMGDGLWPRSTEFDSLRR